MTPATREKHLRFDRETKDFVMDYGDILVGYAATHREAETVLDAFAHTFLTHQAAAAPTAQRQLSAADYAATTPEPQRAIGHLIAALQQLRRLTAAQRRAIATLNGHICNLYWQRSEETA
ncbi:MAG: hypothetical protein MI924_00255 [Chloroflexales bacterium]|nr:hypothetical protein [Chloroflexales bacterium]